MKSQRPINHYVRPHPHTLQSGAALLAFMMLLVLSVSAFLLSGLSPLGHQLDRPFHNKAVLAEAKNAVIAYARLSDPDLSVDSGLNYRYLPCPDQDGDGLEETPCGTASAEGWLPWQSLGLAPLRDASGVCLRYFISSSYKLGASDIPTISAPPAGDFVLSNSEGVISQQIVAVLFAPGEIVAGQARGLSPGLATECGSSALSSDKNQAANYLDAVVGIDNATAPGFVTSPIIISGALNFNDTLMTILTSEL
ncbi:MAG: hypothetical protein KBT88_03220 [Gammaproteobacteria bacterium]|nr:hypothetical protein [Gammaproteobacteria bacterium]MBQ0838770.1 hypothetical protein [Gammaproteobacteria bacterium]